VASLVVLFAFMGIFMISGFIDRFIFFPERTLVGTPGNLGLPYEDSWFSSSDGVRLHGWFVPSGPGDRIVLFCHGNAGNISHRLDNIHKLYDLGVSVFIFDYRGYGRSEGKISEAGFYADAEAAYLEARARADRYGGKLFVFGRSLGGIAATHVASKYPCNGLILESTFTNLGDIARVHYPLPFLNRWLGDRLNAVAKIAAVKAPILFFHGDQDAIVPIRLGRRLFAAAGEPKEFVVLAGAAHNDTYLVGGEAYFKKICDFFNRAAGSTGHN